eukprot:jgi/Hompol1/4512/HPOL_003676-RA
MIVDARDAGDLPDGIVISRLPKLLFELLKPMAIPDIGDAPTDAYICIDDARVNDVLTIPWTEYGLGRCRPLRGL